MSVEQSEAVEVVLMESWLDDDVKCESSHDQIACSGSVTHRAWDCVDVSGSSICRNAAEWNLRTMRNRLTSCVHCGANAEDCWRVVPI